LEFGNARDVGPDLPLERQVLMITKSEDMVKLRALAELCSWDLFDDKSLLVVAWRRILEVLELAMPEEKKVRGKKKNQQRKKKDPKKPDVLDACLALGKACGRVRDFDDGRRYLKRVKEGYEEQLGRDNEKTLETTPSLIIAARMSDGERIEKLRDLLKRMERALGEENVVTLHTLNELGGELQENGEFEEAKEVWERCLAGRMKVIGEDQKDTFESLNNLGVVYDDLKNYKKALEYYKRALEGKERTLGKTHPETLMAVMNTGTTYLKLRDLGKAEELYQRALEGYEVQLGKDHVSTINCA